MSINWNEVKKELIPLKDYEDMCRRFQESFAYPFVGISFNYPIPELRDYTQKLLEGDARGRYTEYAAKLSRIFRELHQAGVKNVLELIAKTDTRENLEIFVEQSGMAAADIVAGLKYLVYWFILNEKYLSGLVSENRNQRGNQSIGRIWDTDQPRIVAEGYYFAGASHWLERGLIMALSQSW
jgi:hypothetical protein